MHVLHLLRVSEDAKGSTTNIVNVEQYRITSEKLKMEKISLQNSVFFFSNLTTVIYITNHEQKYFVCVYSPVN